MKSSTLRTSIPSTAITIYVADRQMGIMYPLCPTYRSFNNILLSPNQEDSSYTRNGHFHFRGDGSWFNYSIKSWTCYQGDASESLQAEVLLTEAGAELAFSHDPAGAGNCVMELIPSHSNILSFSICYYRQSS